MEGGKLNPDGNFGLLYALLLLLLPPLVFTLIFLLSSRLEIRWTTMDPSRLAESSSSEHEARPNSTDLIHSADEAVASIRAPPSPPPSPSPTSCPLSNLLDSTLEEIHIPILQPVLVRHKSRTAESRAGLPPLILLDDELDVLSTPTLEPTRVSPTSTMVTVKDPTPWDGSIRWAIKGCSIFDNSHQELEALTYRPNILSQQGIHDVWIFQYGVRYIPSGQEANIYRTVRIQGLPAHMSLNQILPHIAGEIYCARLLDTRSILGANTAVITFVLQGDAVRFVQNSEHDGLDLGVVSAQVVPVNTPTYPMPLKMERMIFEQNYTRCLCVSHSRGSLKEVIARVLMKSWHADLIESIEDGHLAGEVYVRFHSIKAAAAACELLKGHPGLFRCEFRFLKQFCALPPSPPTKTESNPRVGIWD